MNFAPNLDTGESYVAMNLFQPPTAHCGVFEQALDRAVTKISDLIPVFGLRNPRIGENGTQSYQFCISDEWVASFWSGQLWLAYSLTGEERFKNSARMRRPYFQTVLERPDWHDHDLGFLFSLSCVADWKLTGNEHSREMALRAADFLAARRRQPMRFVMCWNPMRRDPPEFAAQKVGTLNIDSMQAMALLFWAHEQTGQASFADIAHMHLATSAEYLVRDDCSSFHAYEFDPRTGAPVKGFTHQGLSDDSCWSRGQAWAIHGFAQSYLYSGRQEYRDMSARMADYIADKLPEDGVPLWDYDLPDNMHPYRDSSAGAVTAAGLYALAQGFGHGPEAERYTALADRILLGLVQTCDIAGRPEAQGLLEKGAAFVDLDRSDNMLPYGDYYYVEALMRAVGHTEFFW
ncbi:glycoside hydrolase family 88 protein [Aliiruegeria lutimaris]|uniref:Unsaturated chondroitin disaccharide hydrolase n=1 Tax=Aliiruegeria lutimaris TaxID=571298 RepID=A0A1G8UNW4_9RHOB|nr:glycoside hydrolase family 88 protein [Aliiruegeria lutimaris]SDJ55177.1 unsaturated chondroitin disaccharide hydrolase [Aliiruegeria lutimaris]